MVPQHCGPTADDVRVYDQNDFLYRNKNYGTKGIITAFFLGGYQPLAECAPNLLARSHVTGQEREDESGSGLPLPL